MTNHSKKRRIEDPVDTVSVETKDAKQKAKDSDIPSPQSYVVKLIFRLKECFHQLGVHDVDLPALEKMSILIYESMSISSRNYHSVQHVFDISATMTDPIPTLSTLFHDCIYFHVDNCLTEAQKALLTGTYKVDERGKHSFLAAMNDSDDKLLKMVDTIFSYEAGQEIKKGLNEYLSAVIAVRSLEKYLPIGQLAKIACCIEATIPFRGIHPDSGLSAMEHLYMRLEIANKKFDLELSGDELEEAIKGAVTVAINDVGNFASADVYDFLDGTWGLLPEQNENLRKVFCITAVDLQKALNGMYGFFKFFLKPENVFESFRGTPTKKELDWKLELCTRNVTIAKKYVGAKLFAQSVVAAFAVLSGGDAPISLFTGDLPSNSAQSDTCLRMSDFLPVVPEDRLQKCDQIVYHILKNGRKSEFQFDTKESPMAAYLYACMGDSVVEEVLEKVKVIPVEKENAMEILRAVPRESLKIIGAGLKKLALSRSSRIQEIIDAL